MRLDKRHFLILVLYSNILEDGASYFLRHTHLRGIQPIPGHPERTPT